VLAVDEIARYERQLVLPEWGAAGQERVRAARVRVTGRGPAAEAAILYLAGAGVGQLVVQSARRGLLRLRR
jgi:adenylyltransferase/sulfurtransferase